MSQATASKSLETPARQDASPPSSQASAASTATSPYKVLRRDGSVAEFEPTKISVALTKAFIAVEGEAGSSSSKVRDVVSKLTEQVVHTIKRRLPEGGILHIEHIQDQVEIALMRAGEYEVARGYVLYREARAKERSLAHPEPSLLPQINVTLPDGTLQPLDLRRLRTVIDEACAGLGEAVSVDKIFDGTLANLYEGVAQAEVSKSAIFSSRALIEHDPAYAFATARLLLDQIRLEVLGKPTTHAEMKVEYSSYFAEYLNKGVQAGLIDSRLQQFDLEKIGQAIDADRDLKFQYLGLQTLFDRYLLHVNGVRIELPQAFWMRVAMGLSINEIDRELRAIQFYELLSNFDFVSSTPTLFNSGTNRPQLSSCFLTTVSDDLVGIYDAIKENALLSKYSGGLGNDWTPVRGLGAHIKGTNGKSQGVVPFLKVVNDTAVAVNQGGKRQGAVCSYLETWHLDIEEFLELRKNTGDDRRRCHDMNTANWIPDLFMERVLENGQWTLFSPDEVPDLHNVYGQKFKAAYEGYEQKAKNGELRLFKTVPALTLWRKMLSMLFETGHPWMTFKDPCNLRSPQQHIGVVHSSNLCTEITLNTSDKETAVCNLGSINLVAHLKDGGLDLQKLERTCRTAMRMLDNVIDINYYSVSKARHSNLQHRPVGLGLMGFQDALLSLKIAYASEQAVEFADYSQEAISYFAILASSELAQERGAYKSFKGSLWDRGILPQDTIDILAKERGRPIEVERNGKLDWTAVRESIKRWGMRNSNCLAIAPTATISNIIGVSQSIEPTFQNLFVKSNLSGDFTVLNDYLVEELKSRGLWDEVMVHDLKYFEGSVMPIERVPEDLKALYATAFEIESHWLIEAAARRQKWIDQAQSLNLYMAEPSGKKLDEMYKLAWQKGLKTTYYLRTTSATSAEKSTTQTGVLNAVSGSYSTQKSAPQLTQTSNGQKATATKAVLDASSTPATFMAKACSITDPECEACQ
jgi:ribonucleoside-diphosphate reductase alpha chain